jgi:hypothetical protein
MAIAAATMLIGRHRVRRLVPTFQKPTTTTFRFDATGF